MKDDVLHIYLNDHLGASVGAIEHIEHCLARNPEGALGTFLRQLLREVKEDQDVLKDLLRRIGEPENPVKQAAAWMAEKVHRLKPNDNLLGYTALARLEELEGLATGLSGKIMLWDALAATCADDARFKGIEWNALAQRTQEQRNEIERHRLNAAHSAFVPHAAETE